MTRTCPECLAIIVDPVPVDEYVAACTRCGFEWVTVGHGPRPWCESTLVGAL